MSTRSHAQQGEDALLRHLMRTLNLEPLWVDIGAGHPIKGNNFYAFYEAGWHGIDVEPNATYASLYGQLRPRDIVITAAVTASGTRAELLVPADGSRLATVDPDRAAALAMRHGPLERVPVEAVSVEDVLAHHRSEHPRCPAPNVLSMDIEGIEAHVLARVDWERTPFRVICVESSAGHTETGYGAKDYSAVNLLCDVGFQVVADLPINTVLVDGALLARGQPKLRGW